MLGLRGFKAGLPGAVEVPVWLAVNALEARGAMQEGGVKGDGVVILSLDVPSDADELDRRHGRSATRGVVLAQPRELPHLRRSAGEAGYSVDPPEGRRAAAAEARATFLEEVEKTLDSEDLLPYLLLLEPLLQKREAAEVAAALAHQLRRTRPASGEPSQGTPGGSDGGTQVVAARPPAWVRIFLSLGERDGVGPGDVLGAILGETGIGRDQVGRIDLHDTYSRVEVHEAVANRVIGALNGTTIRGRSVRADFDRKEHRTAPGKGSTEGGEPRRGSQKPGSSRGRPRGGGGREGGGRGDR
jgi:ATP-dependent RNA helicase DeaD